MSKIDLRKLAAQTNPTTQAKAKEALKSVGLKQSLFCELLAALDAINTARADKRLSRNLLRISRDKNRAPMSLGYVADFREPKTTGAGGLAKRLDELRKQALKAAFSGYRIGANDNVEFKLSEDPKAIGVVQIAATDWNKYGGSYKGWACNYRITTITAPTTWRLRVAANGLACVDGLMTLDAQKLDSQAGVEVFSATWLVQGRGNEIKSASGFIARGGGFSYHAETYAKAVAGVAKKAKIAADARWFETTNVADVVAKNPDVIVTVKHARRIGACEYGIKSWCSAVGIDYEAGRAPAKDVFAAYMIRPAREARAAILAAIKQSM